MQYMDCVEVTVEKEKYTKDGVHKGMQGWICLDDFVNGTWLVNFPQCGEKADIAEISVKEEDLKARFDQMDEDQKAISDVPDDLSKYLV